MTLSEALEPLYRGYLRRLEEMVSRLPEGAALTERTTRGDDGKLVLGNGGLPVRFDVADARDGDTLTFDTLTRRRPRLPADLVFDDTHVVTASPTGCSRAATRRCTPSMP